MKVLYLLVAAFLVGAAVTSYVRQSGVRTGPLMGVA